MVCHVLVVDDEPLMVPLAKRQLGDRYDVTGCTSPQSALAQIAKNADEFDAVVVDAQLPSMSGAELAMALWDIRPDLPILFTSGDSDVLASLHAHMSGPHQILCKPYTTAQLQESVGELLLRAVADCSPDPPSQRP